MNVYQAIAAVSKELAAQGIRKDSRNAAQGFSFRGIDAVYNALAPLLAKHGLCILPRCIERQVIERINAKGNALFYVTVHAEFDFVSAEDGSKHTVSTYGEAMDSGDKATNKAMSAAYKYAAFQAFCIPTEETAVDADAETHDVAPVNLEAILLSIESSLSLDQLKNHFTAALQALPKQHHDALIKAKDQRKAELSQGVPA